MSISPPAARSAENRESGLDALRGLAALSVVVLHLVVLCLGTSYPEYSWWDRLIPVLDRTPISLIWAGHQAVLLFFILSGFALYRMLETRDMSYSHYVVRRVFRLWPPYVAALAFAGGSIALLGSRHFDQLSGWMNMFLGKSVTCEDVLLHLTMVADFDVTKLNPVIWSLIHEMRMSLVFPPIYLLLRRFGGSVVLTASFIVAAGVVAHAHWMAMPIGATAVRNTFVLQFCFVGGAVIAQSRNSIVDLYGRIPQGTRWLLALGALVLYSDCLPVIGRTDILDLFRVDIAREFGVLGVVAGAAWIVISAISSPALKAVLSVRPLLELGRLSYSLYLFHYVILLGTLNAVGASSPLRVVLVALPLSFLVAFLANRLVEEPSNLLGRKLVSWQRSRSKPAAEATIS